MIADVLYLLLFVAFVAGLDLLVQLAAPHVRNPA